MHCPPLKDYSKADDILLDAEIHTAPQGFVFPNYINDYGKLRAECRALKEKK